jgi:pentapeptide repeat protein
VSPRRHRFETAVPISNGPELGADPVERTGAAQDEVPAEAVPARKESYRLEAESYVCRTRFDARRRCLPEGERVRSAVEAFASARDAGRPRIVCLRLGTGGVAILADAANPTQVVIINGPRGIPTPEEIGVPMIVIRHKETGEPLLEVAADTLAGADLEGAMLLCADLKGADLRGAHLRVVDLCQADLRGATLDEADLRDADATLANLVGATRRLRVS